MQKHLLFKHVDLVDQLVYCLTALLADAFVILEDILRAYVRRTQIIEEKSLELLPDVVMVDPHWVLSIPGIMGKILKVSLC